MDNQSVKRQLQDIYHRLFTTYGPQHWWPAEEPFEVMVGAILTQSAAWLNVEKAIATLIHSCGYYNTKARKLRSLAHWLGECCQDDLDRLFHHSAEWLREQLLSVYGIGEETADSIILYAADKAVFVIDAYTRRIIDRVGLSPDNRSYAAYQALFRDNLPADARLFNEYHALLVCLGKSVCRNRPLCPQCCLSNMCRFRDNG